MDLISCCGTLDASCFLASVLLKSRQPRLFFAARDFCAEPCDKENQNRIDDVLCCHISDPFKNVLKGLCQQYNSSKIVALLWMVVPISRVHIRVPARGHQDLDSRLAVLKSTPVCQRWSPRRYRCRLIAFPAPLALSSVSVASFTMIETLEELLYFEFIELLKQGCKSKNANSADGTSS